MHACTHVAHTDIPALDLSGRVASPVSPLPRAQSPVSSTGATAGEGSDPPSRRTSFSSAGGRSSTPGGRTSRSSSRSTSFNLPNEAREVIRLDGRQPGDEVDFEEMDEESACPCRWRFHALHLPVVFACSFAARLLRSARSVAHSRPEARGVRARARATLL